MTQNIECVFYDSIQFIEEAVKKGGRVLVHCVQGVSRSTTICMAYLIFKFKYTYDQAFAQVRLAGKEFNLSQLKKCRAVTSPNTGFIVQLLHFYKRLYEPIEDFPMAPKVFCVGSHERENQERIVAKLV